jgi:hypothetical protein
MKKKLLKKLEKEIRLAKRNMGFKNYRIVVESKNLDFKLANPLSNIEEVQLEIISTNGTCPDGCYIDENGDCICNKIISSI